MDALKQSMASIRSQRDFMPGSEGEQFEELKELSDGGIQINRETISISIYWSALYGFVFLV